MSSEGEGRLCSACVHAALDSAGVYCKMFTEQILNERVAEECGEFEADNWQPRLMLLPDQQPDRERERSVSFRVEVDYFGKAENGDTIVRNLERALALHYGEKARVKRL